MKCSLNVGGIVPFTTIDYPGCLSAVIFCQGCPYRCIYCHNQHLLSNKRNTSYSWVQIYAFLQSRIGYLEAVVFSGGEPTVQSSLYGAMLIVKNMGFKVGLHTSGAYPHKLKTLIPLLDWVGLDIKADFHNYQMITQVSQDGLGPLRSLELLLKSGVDLECRTTFHSSYFSRAGIVSLAQKLKRLGVKKYVLQPYRSQGVKNTKLTPDHPDIFQNIQECVIRIFA